MNEYKPYKSKEIQDKILDMKEKLFKTNALRDYSGKEQALITAAYYQQGQAYTGRGKTLSQGCSSCFKDAVNLIKNHINLYNSRYIEPELKGLKPRGVLSTKGEEITEEDKKVILKDFDFKGMGVKVVSFENGNTEQIGLDSDPIDEAAKKTIKELEQIPVQIMNLDTGEVYDTMEEAIEAFQPKTKRDYVEALKHLGVPMPRNANKKTLIELWEKNR